MLSNVLPLISESVHFVLGDCGYRGVPEIHANRARNELAFDPEVSRQIARDRAAVERAFGRLKVCNDLHTRS